MAEISKINIGGTTYHLKDSTARGKSVFEACSWQTLKEHVREGELEPGVLYRITDYVTRTKSAVAYKSAGHVFDVVVLALSEDVLSEDAWVVAREGDSYFEGCNLGAWRVKYCLDNDSSRFDWADTSADGRGVIYWMKDEWGNECGYDFKNILHRKGGTYSYTFTSDMNASEANQTDTSLNMGCSAGNYVRGNVCGSCFSNGTRVLKTVFFEGYAIADNRVGENCENVVVKDSCVRNVIGDRCWGVTFYRSCADNVVGNSCNGVYFEGANSSNNVVGNNCSNVWFSNNCTHNEIGINCNEFHLGYGGLNNVVGAYCNNVNIGSSCYRCNIGNNCSYINLCSYCDNISIGNNSDNVELRHSEYTKCVIGENAFNILLQAACTRRVQFMPNCQRITISDPAVSSSFTSSENGDIAYLQNVIVYPLNTKDLSEYVDSSGNCVGDSTDDFQITAHNDRYLLHVAVPRGMNWVEVKQDYSRTYKVLHAEMMPSWMDYSGSYY